VFPKTKEKRGKKKKKYMQGVMLGFVYLMSDCWLEVRLHPKGPALGQIDRDSPWFSLVSEQTLNWYSDSTLHCMLHIQPSKW
jgi:hypothetical protein